MKKVIDLTPKPVVLTTLGEITLEVWQCLAEFIDNSIDSFLSAKNGGIKIARPNIDITLPTHNSDDSFISVIDNGAGMTQKEIIEVARAGYSNRAGEKDYLGLWGMGLNVASARLGGKLEIHSLVSGSAICVEIDLESMRQQDKFVGIVRDLTPKEKSIFLTGSGTLVKVSKLKSEITEMLISSGKRDAIKEQIGRVYSPVLISGDPLTINIKINRSNVPGHVHFNWQQKEVPIGKTVHYDIKHNYSNGEIRGWIGLQKYSDRNDFGIDFIRNGRKIELGNKEIFDWDNDGKIDKEYPIDDPRARGRIIGEIHLDSCSVPFSKDRFNRADVGWHEMLKVVRGGKDFPLRSNKAKAHKGATNTSPLGKIYKDFRRSVPNSTTDAEKWLSLLSFPDNDFPIKNQNAPGTDWYRHLNIETRRFIAKKLKEKEEKAKGKKGEASTNTYGQKNFPEIYRANVALSDPYLRGIVEDINQLRSEKTPIACCVCLRALVEVALKSKISDLADADVENSLLTNNKGTHSVGLGVLLDNMNKVYTKDKKKIFGKSELDQAAKSFCKTSSRFADFLNGVSHGNMISGATQADDFAKECAVLITRLLTTSGDNQ